MSRRIAMIIKAVTVNIVRDGDSFGGVDVNDNQGEYRLLGFDAPERGEPGYETAKEELEGWINGWKVTVQGDVIDDFDRLLVYVTTQRVYVTTLTDINVNAEMKKKVKEIKSAVSLGLGQHYK